MGIAMGCMGMSMDDFCRCTPSEFYEVYESWGDMRTMDERARWERARMQCLCSLQPYSKSRLRPQDIMQFPWETAGSEGRRASGSEERRVKSEESDGASEQKELSHEEIMARYREAKKRAGLL